MIISAIILSIFLVVIILFFAMKNILASIYCLQNGLYSFFSYLNRKTSNVQLIEMDSKVDFIKSENNKFNSFSADEFVEKVSWSLGELDLEEKNILKNYFEVTYKFQNNPNYIVWAFISWEK